MRKTRCVREDVGNKYGYLTVIEDMGMDYISHAWPRHVVKCICICGNVVECNLSQMKFGEKQSCGCMTGYLKTQHQIIHGYSNHRLFRIWAGIKQRCYNPKHNAYKHYGERGITLCNEWINDSSSFIKYCMTLDNWDKPDYSIDRIDNDGNYEPNNIRFGTQHIQTINSRRKISKSGYIGVEKFIYKTGTIKYMSSICVYGKRIRFNVCDTLKEALDLRNNFIIQNKLTEYSVQFINEQG